MAADSLPPMTDEELRLLSDAIHAYAGLRYREEMRFLLERRLGPRALALGLPDFGSYYRYLRYEPNGRAELVAAVELLLTHETYFFREVEQLRALRDHVVPELVAAHAASRQLRLWCAGCSTGEEPYTVAVLLAEVSALEGWDVSILGTDLSKRALAAARKAEYGANALRSTPPEALERFFVEEPSGRHRVRDEIRGRVTFGHVNLLDPLQLALVGRVDVVLCRNVMIYFDAEARQRVLGTFHDKLQEGGYLLLGRSENLLHTSADFEMVHLPDELVYRRPRA